jgi:hypothetical protein
VYEQAGILDVTEWIAAILSSIDRGVRMTLIRVSHYSRSPTRRGCWCRRTSTIWIAAILSSTARISASTASFRDPAVHDPGLALPRRPAAGHPAGRGCGEPSRISIRKLGITSSRSGIADRGMTSRARAYCAAILRYYCAAILRYSDRVPR